MIRRTAERVDWKGAALLAALALLVQALLPGAVMARAAATDGTGFLQICSAAGVKSVAIAPAPGNSKGFAGFKCADCVFASITATMPAQVFVPVRHERMTAVWSPSAQGRVCSIRGPPRPPARAPPVSA